MELLNFSIKKILYGFLIILGSTFICFFLMVYCGPDKTYDLLGKNPTIEQIKAIHHDLGYDKPFIIRYKNYLKDILTFNFGRSESSGKKVSEIFTTTIPISLEAILPGFILGNLLAIFLGLLAIKYRGAWQDKALIIFSTFGLSISSVIIIIAFQIIFCSSYGLNLFPVQGWKLDGILDYVKYVSMPTLIITFISLGYNVRFYRSIFLEESSNNHIVAARAFGASNKQILLKNILRNSLIPIITRIAFMLPFIIVGGSILIESYFSIPGIGLVIYDAILTGDQIILKAAIAWISIIYVIILILIEIIYTFIDPRISLG